MKDSKFGERLRSLRKEKGWSQEYLAEQLNVSRQAVYKWESNKGYPDIANLIEISELFDVSIDELIKEDKDLQKEMASDEKDLFEQVSDPGFYLGVVLFFIGILTDFGSLSTILMFGGLFIMVFYNEFLKILKLLIRDFKGVFKG